MVTEGIIVSKVMDGGPAKQKGIQNHDQIAKVGQQLCTIQSTNQAAAYNTENLCK